MTNTQFREALTRLGLNYGQAAELLGCTSRTIQNYASGKPIPKAVEMALDSIKEQSK